MRKEFQMTDAQHKTLMDACKPTPVMFISGGAPMFNTPQENATEAWRRLGEELNFKHMSVLPVQGKGPKFFSAEV